MNYRKYIKKIEKLCGEKKGFMVLFKDELYEEALSPVYKKLNISNIKPLVRVKKDGLEINIFKTGKIIVKGLDDEGELWRFLDALYRK